MPSSCALTTRVLVGCKPSPASAVHCASRQGRRPRPAGYDITPRSRLRSVPSRNRIRPCDGRAGRALRSALFQCPFSVAVQHALFEKALDQRQNSTVQHLLADQGEKAIFRNGVEVTLQIGIATTWMYPP
jgi:hypothetical protein